jgi:short-subunit dehydrogenase
MKKYSTAIITGASSGIGLAFAVELAKSATNLLLISRNRTKLNSIKTFLEGKYNINVWLKIIDLSVIEEIRTIGEFLEQNFIFPDLFINNAGFGVYGKFNETDDSKIVEMIKVNVIAPSVLCRIIGNNMMKNQGGTILNVSSTLAFRQSPLWSLYASTKAYILSLTKSLSQEFEGTGVNFAVLCPGKTRTEFDKRAEAPLCNDDKKLIPELVVKYSLDKLSRGKTLIIPGFANKFKYSLFKYSPNWISRKIVNLIFDK